MRRVANGSNFLYLLKLQKLRRSFISFVTGHSRMQNSLSNLNMILIAIEDHARIYYGTLNDQTFVKLRQLQFDRDCLIAAI